MMHRFYRQQKLFLACFAAFHLIPSLTPRQCQGLFLFNPASFFWSRPIPIWRNPQTRQNSQKNRVFSEKLIPYNSPPSSSDKWISQPRVSSTRRDVESSLVSLPETSNYLRSSDFTGSKSLSRISDETLHQLLDAPLTIFQVKQPKEMRTGQLDFARGGRMSDNSEYFSKDDNLRNDYEADHRTMETKQTFSNNFLLTEKTRLIEEIKRAWDLAMGRVGTKPPASRKGFDPWHGKRRKRSTEFQYASIKDNVDNNITAILKIPRIPVTRKRILLPPQGTEKFLNNTLKIRALHKGVLEDSTQEISKEDIEDQFLNQTHNVVSNLNETLLDSIFKKINDTTPLTHQMETIKEELIRQTESNRFYSKSNVQENISSTIDSLAILTTALPNEEILKRKPVRVLFHHFHLSRSKMTKPSFPKQKIKASSKTNFPPPSLRLPKEKDLDLRLTLKTGPTSSRLNIKRFGPKLSADKTMHNYKTGQLKINKSNEGRNNIDDLRAGIDDKQNSAKSEDPLSFTHTPISKGKSVISLPRLKRMGIDHSNIRSLGLSKDYQKNNVQRFFSRIIRHPLRQLLVNLLKYQFDAPAMKHRHRDQVHHPLVTTIPHSLDGILFNKQRFNLRQKYLSDNKNMNGSLKGINVWKFSNNRSIPRADVGENRTMEKPQSFYPTNLNQSIDINPINDRRRIGKSILSSVTKRTQARPQDNVRKLNKGNIINLLKTKLQLIRSSVHRCVTHCQRQRRFTRSADMERPVQEDTHSNMSLRDPVDLKMTGARGSTDSKFQGVIKKASRKSTSTGERTALYSKDLRHDRPRSRNKSIVSLRNFFLLQKLRIGTDLNQNPTTAKRDTEKTDSETLNNLHSSAQGEVKAQKVENPVTAKIHHKRSKINGTRNRIVWETGLGKLDDKIAGAYKGVEKEKMDSLASIIFKRCFKETKAHPLSQKMVNDLGLILSLLNQVVTSPQTPRGIFTSFPRQKPEKSLIKSDLQSSRNPKRVVFVNRYFRKTKQVPSKTKIRRKRDLSGLTHGAKRTKDKGDFPQNYPGRMADLSALVQRSRVRHFGDADETLYDINSDKANINSRHSSMQKRQGVQNTLLKDIPMIDTQNSSNFLGNQPFMMPNVEKSILESQRFVAEPMTLEEKAMPQFDRENIYETLPVLNIKRSLPYRRNTRFDRRNFLPLPLLKSYESENIFSPIKLQDSSITSLREMIKNPYPKEVDAILPVIHHRKHTPDSSTRVQTSQKLRSLYKNIESNLAENRHTHGQPEYEQLDSRAPEQYDLDGRLSEILERQPQLKNAHDNLRQYPDAEEVTLTYLQPMSSNTLHVPSRRAKDWLAAFSIVRPLGFSQFVN